MPVDRELPTHEAARPHRADPRAGRRRAGAARPAQYEREERFPREVFRMLGERRPARPALRRGRRRRRPALRGLPAGGRGAGRPLGQRRARRQRAHAVLLPDRPVRHRGAAPRPAARHGRRRAARRLLPVGGARRLRPGRHAGHAPSPATTAGWPAARRPGSPTAATPTSTRRSCAPRTTASAGISCFHLTPDLPGFSAARPEEKMGLTGSTTAAIRLDDVPVPADRLVGERGRGLSIALAALDSGRLGRQRRRGRARAVRARRRRPATPRERRGVRPARSSSTRAWPSCSPTWPPRSSRPARPTWSPPAARTPASRTRGRPASPSWWPPTRP